MTLLSSLKARWKGIEEPFLIHPKGELRFSEIKNQDIVDLSVVKNGDVVALIGDFDPKSIRTFLELFEKNVIILPLTNDTRTQHSYFFESALVDVVIEKNSIRRITHDRDNSLINHLRKINHAGLVYFSSGTTGRPKAILHDLTLFTQRFETPRPKLKAISFLLFDHLGGLNTLLHVLFNRGTVIAPKSRSVEDILKASCQYQVEVLPTTPTFLRTMLMSGLIPEKFPPSIKIVSYGSERMDQPTLDALCELLPNVDFRQTFGTTELGVVRAKSKSRDSLYMKIGGKGVETRVVDSVLEIRSTTGMLGYLNNDSPFDPEGWYNTKDLVETCGDYFKIIGRTSEVINVAGLKFMASEIERVALEYDGIELAKAEGKINPITGQHVELSVQPAKNWEINKSDLKSFLTANLPKHMAPKRLVIGNIKVGHRYKKL